MAILLFEDDAQHYIDVMHTVDHIFISAATYFELGIVYDRHPSNKSTSDDVTALKHSLALELVSVDEALAEGARRAYKQFGRGNHAAKLNFGDCFSYALAKSLGLPLLFKGTDFSQTDIIAA